MDGLYINKQTIGNDAIRSASMDGLYINKQCSLPNSPLPFSPIPTTGNSSISLSHTPTHPLSLSIYTYSTISKDYR
ncbi:hypothetical protein L6452_19270 [Arctium lappa]|uniref:Uncharacterized protein n=1 Tax=Arctium lappa TaxID=4217 RepID=A0ACB9B842_ARCLA|nr:hypothetical protein L6452_19270 [Arctium lappa]